MTAPTARPSGATAIPPGATAAPPGTGRDADLPRRPSPGLVARVLLVPLRGYRRFVSPLLPARCRFAPTCSAYAVEAVTAHGAVRGTGLALWRLARCQPFHPGGHDPVPPVARPRTSAVSRRSSRTGAGRPTERSGVSPC